MAKAKAFTISEADEELQAAYLKAASARNAEKARRDEAKARLHAAVKELAEAQRALSGPPEAWNDADWQQSAAHQSAAAALLKA